MKLNTLIATGALMAGCFSVLTALGGQYDIQIGDSVSEDSPGPGAGRLDASNETDTYRFPGTAGQLVFFDEGKDNPAFQGWLFWEVFAPSGAKVFGKYLNGGPEGRRELEETGTYQIRVYVWEPQASRVGPYSFGIYSIPPDSQFAIAVGDTVSPGQPQQGAGVIEVAGARDLYTFNGTAGQLVFFEEISDDAAFGGWLHWQLNAPGGEKVFGEYLDESNPGRITLPSTGTYTLQVWSYQENLAHVGNYSFRLRPIPPDQQFAIKVGDTVSDGVPEAGAGRLEVPGARDIYRFQASAGQALFFEDLGAASEFAGWLLWEVRAPSGKTLFSEYLDDTSAGRKDLTETGTYELTVLVASPVPSYVGSYSFRIRSVGGDTRYPITIGQVVSAGAPGAGAGTIETPGGEDVYRFDAVAGQKVVFDEISSAASFVGWLRWQVQKPDGSVLEDRYFDSDRLTGLTLPTTGTYNVRVYVGDVTPSHVGDYSFRLYSDVTAQADNLITAPGKLLVVPAAKFLCNDTHEPGDSLSVDLPLTQSQRGGTLTSSAAGISYAPPPGFIGTDSFSYRIRGQFGGESTTVVTVRVIEGADSVAMVVSLRRVGPALAEVCLLGRANQTYRVEESTDMVTWTFRENITANGTGEMVYQYQTDSAPQHYFRFK